MSKRSSFQQKSVLKTSLRLAMAAAVLSLAGFVVLLIVVFNITREQVGQAQTSMVFKNAETIQDTSTVLRGSINQNVIGVVVEASGKGNPLHLNAMVFNAQGTSLPIEQNIENARLWYTAGEPNFMPMQQLGTTLVKITGNDFEIACNQNLKTGKNYFWLTFDIKPEAAYAPGAIDATCQEIRIGAILYKPLISSPQGKRFTEPNIPYFSMGNFSVGNLNAWNSRRDGSGTAPKQINASRNTYFVQSGHRMICNSAGANLQAMVVEKGGELKITSPLRLNTMNVAYGGTVQQDATVNDYYCFNEFNMDNGANYIHNNTGYLPGLKCNFAPRSNQTFFQVGAATFNDQVIWGNVTIDITTPVDLDITHNFRQVNGDLEIRKTGIVDQHTPPHHLFVSESDTMNVAGNFIVSGGNFSGTQGLSGKVLAIRVGKNLILKSGEFNDALTQNAKSGTTLSVQGDIMLMGGNFRFDRCMSSRLILEGNANARWIQNPTCSVSLGNVEVASNKTLSLKGERMGNIAAHALLEVKPGAQLYCYNFPVTGSGNFLLRENATLGIGSPEGISSTGATGNIQTAGRIFHSDAHYAFVANTPNQVTGRFETRPEGNTVRSLIIDKEQMSNTLTLSQDLKVTGQVSINKGELREGKFELKLPRISEN